MTVALWFAVGLAAAGLVTWASLALSATVWKHCPRCGRWESDLGHIDSAPGKGRIGSAQQCDECRSV